MSSPRTLRPVKDVRQGMTSDKLVEYLNARPDLTPTDKRIRYLLFKADQTLSASRAGQRLFKTRPAAYAGLLKDVFNAYIEFGEQLPSKQSR